MPSLRMNLDMSLSLIHIYYMYNTNYNMTIKTYEDNDTEDQVTKAVMICDGKVIDKNSLVTVTKKNA